MRLIYLERLGVFYFRKSDIDIHRGCSKGRKAL